MTQVSEPVMLGVIHVGLTLLFFVLVAKQHANYFTLYNHKKHTSPIFTAVFGTMDFTQFTVTLNFLLVGHCIQYPSRCAPAQPAYAWAHALSLKVKTFPLFLS